jgi:uncharacterized protein YyaL (SSP411 family)
LPSGTAVHALNLARLAALTGQSALHERALASIDSLGGMALRYPQAFSQLFLALDFLRGQPREVVIAGEGGAPATQALLRAVRSTFRPQRVVALATSESDTTLLPLLADKTPGPSGARAYVCEQFLCSAPVDSAEQLATELARR